MQKTPGDPPFFLLSELKMHRTKPLKKKKRGFMGSEKCPWTPQICLALLTSCHGLSPDVCETSASSRPVSRAKKAQSKFFLSFFSLFIHFFPLPFGGESLDQPLAIGQSLKQIKLNQSSE